MEVQDRKSALAGASVGDTDAKESISFQGKEALKDVTFGSVAGIIGKIIEYPFDTVKVRLQSQPDHLPLRYKGPLDCFRQSVHNDGLRTLYRGVSAPLVGAAVETSSLFFSYRIAQDLLTGTILATANPLPLSALITCGAVSGAFTSLVLTPIELIKCKMQVPLEHSAGSAFQPRHAHIRPGPLAIIASVYRQQGLLGFWHGQLGTLIRETGGSAAWFGSYEGVSAFFRKARTASHPATPADTSLPISQQLLAGAAAGMSYNFLFYPADTIKSRMQTDGDGKRTFWDTGKGLWRQHGLRGMYRGCGITVGRSAPSSAFIFTIYEWLKNAF